MRNLINKIKARLFRKSSTTTTRELVSKDETQSKPEHETASMRAKKERAEEGQTKADKALHGAGYGRVTDQLAAFKIAQESVQAEKKKGREAVKAAVTAKDDQHFRAPTYPASSSIHAPGKQSKSNQPQR
jgi:hypothetical protein